MSFLAPLFFLGTLAVGLPVIFHLIRRTTRERKPFGSLMFLLESPPRLTQRSRLEHLLLLALRCLAIGLLAFGFARPFVKHAMTAPSGTNGRRILILVDTSASMRRSGLWSEAQRRMGSILKNASPLDQVSLVAFDRQTKPIFTFNEWNGASLGDRAGLFSAKLAQLSPGWGATQLGSALIQAAETLAEPGGNAPASPGIVELITDFQEGSHLEQLEGYEWPKGIEVNLNALKPRSPNNASLQLVTDSEDSGTKDAGLRVRAANASGSKREQFKVGWVKADGSGLAGNPKDVYVPAGQSRILPVEVPSVPVSDRILLQGDDEEFDNVVFAKAPEPVRLDILYLGNDEESNSKQPLYFLKRAFQETRRQVVNVTACRPKDFVPASQAQAGRLFVVTAPVSDDSASALRRQVEGGKTLLVIPAGPAMLPTLRHLLELDHLDYQEVRPGNYALLSEIDFRHPLFAPFADPRFSDFSKIHFWAYSRLDASGIPHAHVLARFDSGDPALIEVPAGSGRMLILTSGWEPSSSQLALSSKFVPLLYSILETSAGASPPPAQYAVGDIVPLEQFFGTISGQAAQVRLPDGSKKDLTDGQGKFSGTDLPGVYALIMGGVTKSFVVNLDPSESRTAPVGMDELERLGVPTIHGVLAGTPEAERKARFQNNELENRQKLWRWFIAGTLGVLLLESWLAGRTARQASRPVTLAAG